MTQYTKQEHEKIFCWCGKIKEPDEQRCTRHKNTLKPTRKKIGPYSGDSKWRQEMGQFQAKEGR